MNQRVFVDGTPVILRRDDFVAAGGQGRVFARGDVAFKVFDNSGAVPPREKLDELRTLVGPSVCAPQRDITDAHLRRIGYTMPFIHNARSWGQCSTPAFRRRMGLGTRSTMQLVQSLANAIGFVHQHGVTIVDLSDNNVLVSGCNVHLIDVDSWQTPRHLASAVTPAIESPHTLPGQFSDASDWFAFAVLTTMLLLGVHPFKGRHPHVRGLEARMRAGLSVFSPQVRTPPSCVDPEHVSEPLRNWLRRTLEEGPNGPPPACGHFRRRRPLPRPHNSTIEHTYPSRIRWVIVEADTLVVATDSAAFDGDDCWHDDGRPVLALGRTQCGRAFVVQQGARGPEVRVRDVDARAAVPLLLSDVVSDDGDVVIRSGARLVALEVRLVGSTPVVLPRELARVLPHATHLFPGVALQNVVGTWRMLLLNHARGTPQFALPGVGAGVVRDARRSGERLVVMIERGGVLTKIAVRLTSDGAPADLHTTESVDADATTFADLQGLHVEICGSNVYISDNPGPPLATLDASMPSPELHKGGGRLVVSSGARLREIRVPEASAAPGICRSALPLNHRAR